MNKTLKVILIVFGVLVSIAVIWIALILYFYVGVRPYVPDLVYTVDRSRVIIPSINYNKEDYEDFLQVHLEVQDTKSGETLFQVQTNASDRMNWSVDWMGNNTVILNSSDIGTYCWVESSDKNWAETECP